MYLCTYVHLCTDVANMKFGNAKILKEVRCLQENAFQTDLWGMGDAITQTHTVVLSCVLIIIYINRRFTIHSTMVLLNNCLLDFRVENLLNKLPAADCAI